MSLAQLKLDLKNADVEDEELFHRLVNETMDALHLRDEDIARLFTMSRPSVRRWMQGRSAPHPAMRTPVYRKLLQLVEASIHPVPSPEEESFE